MRPPPNQGAPANRRPAGQSDGSDYLSATLAADRAFPAAVAELGSLDVFVTLMANGRHTVDCLECRDHFFKPGVSDMFCRRWKIRLHRERYGTLNMFCRDYRRANDDGPTLGGLEPHMESAILYAIFYNDLGDPFRLRKVRNLKTKRYVDGHPAKWKALSGYA